MLSDTTVGKAGWKDLPIKSTGCEKVCVSVYLTAQVNEKKVKLFNWKCKTKI